CSPCGLRCRRWLGAARSFPTRRSSDLRFAKLCGGREARIAIIPTASLASDTGRRYESLFDDLGVAHAEALPLESRHDCEQPEALDRKSTRLNSSHVKMSYAVFCLKKKK